MDDRGQFCNEGVPQQHSAPAESSTLSVTVTYHRNTSAPKSGATSAAAALAAGAASASAASLPDSRNPETAEPPAAAHESIKPAKFPRICSFSVRLPPNQDFNPVGAHVRLCSHPPLLCISAELETCGADAPCCLGTVLSCTPDTAHASLHTLHVEVFRHMLYLPGSPKQLEDGTLTEVVHVFPDKSDQLTAEIESRKAVIAFHQEVERAREKAEQFDQFMDIKKQALLLSTVDFQINSDELGMVRLRQGFLASQPFISSVLKWLMRREEWYGSACDDACIRFFRSSSGPWDIFSMFNFLMRSKTPNNPDTKDIFGMTADAIGPSGNVAERDQFRERLQLLFNNIFCVRNWWAHLGAGSLDCNRALKSAKDFVQILADSELLKSSFASYPVDPSKLLAKMDRILDATQETLLTIDDVAYVLFLRASRQICKFCTEVFGTLRCSRFSEEMLVKLRNKSSKTSRRQSEAIEVCDVSTVLRALFNSDPHVSFDCSIITTTRNSLSHASEDRNQIILVAMALGAIARVGSVIVDRCLEPSCLPAHASAADAERAKLLQEQGREICSSVALFQAELLDRCGLLDVDKLITHIHEKHEPLIAKCEFSELISAAGQTSALKFRAVKFLLDRKLRGVSDAPEIDERLQCAAGESKERKQEKKALRSLLYTVARIPPNRRRTVDAAVEWLVEGNVSDSGLLQSSGLRLLIENDDNEGFFSSDLASDTTRAAAAAFQNHARQLNIVHKAHSDVIKSKREYEMACFGSEKHRMTEEQFCSAHPQPVSPDLSQEVNFWRGRVEFFAEAERAEEAAQLRCKAEHVHTALVGLQAANAEFENSSDAEALAGVKLFLQR